MTKETKDIARAMNVLPRLMRHFLGTFKPGMDVPIKKNEVKTLFELDMHPNMPMRHYADAVDMEFGSFTYLADKLEKKGIVKRVHSENDKRVIVLSLTDAGLEMSKKIKDKFDTHITERISTLDKEDLHSLSQATDLLENILSKLKN